ncbi:Hint domain-containing protein [Pelagovum pacificum]|uniref:Hedgehog/Intein (Hint) domain-containing protein n=1 Tax=Pelagovum pacificum TaxID=2588711 RepID=A0A5C5GF41_9RHOB|nr:Hint domain-containing protein [Pelagovum pacificum]QQA43488.1 Hint domain-containing protein [Pelagovum pacificum]TNY33375.1 hypothetical protein FHY64_08915 [Pelagovum pacificum]
MANYSLHIFDISHISTDDPDGFDDNGGYQFEVGVNTVTLSPTAVSQEISVTDWNNQFFDDDGGSGQILNGDWTINGTTYASGTNIEGEYVLLVEDSAGTEYGLQFVSLNNDAFKIEGFVVHGGQPPRGEPLTIVAIYDNVVGYLEYAGSTPSCFAGRTRIDTDRGPIPAAELRPGAMLSTWDGLATELRLVLRRTMSIDSFRRAPIRFHVDALGQGCPSRTLFLSPQHRVLVEGQLIAARQLSALPRIGPLRRPGRIDYVHLVTAKHALLIAEGLPCESFWPGPQALSGLRPAERLAVTAIMGPDPPSVRPFASGRTASQLVRLAAGRRSPVGQSVRT